MESSKFLFIFSIFHRKNMTTSLIEILLQRISFQPTSWNWVFFPDIFVQARLKNFINNNPREMFHTLLKILYSISTTRMRSEFPVPAHYTSQK